MTLNILFSARPERWDEYHADLRRALAAADLHANLSRDHAPETVDYIVYAPNGGLQDFSVFPRCKAVLSLWAGVETIVGNPTLTQPLARMVDAGLQEGMVEWVTGHVLRHHLGMDAHIVNPEKRWDAIAPPLARDRVVTVLGLGALGTACATALAALNFNVRGWSRTAKDVPGIACHSGPDGFAEALDGAEFVILLMPLTPQTENILNAAAIARLASGAVILNPGRGPLIDDEALLDGLETGQIGHATLDTFRTEPLPGDHPFWDHPAVTVTPHIASETRASTASEVVAENIRRSEAGDPLLYLVDRQRGY